MTNQPEPLPLEPRRGSRTPTSGSDRLLLLLAVLVFAAAATMVIGNLLPEAPLSAEASPAARTPSATQRATRPPATPPPPIVVEPGAPPTAPPISEFSYQGWLRARTELEVQPQPDPESIPTGHIPAGGIAVFQRDPGLGWDPPPGWLNLVDWSTPGWVQVEVDGVTLADQYPMTAAPVAPEVWVAGSAPDSLMLQGAVVDPTTGIWTPWQAVTRDGTSWQQSHSPDSAFGLAGPVWGPAGWVELSADAWGTGPPGLWVSQSWNGFDWTTLGSMSMSRASSYPDQLVGSSEGYLLLVSNDSGASQAWYSVDAQTWTAAMDLGLSGQPTFSAGPLGFYAWDSGHGSSDPHAAFSLDGVHWQPLAETPSAPSMVAWTDTIAVALEHDPQGSAAHVWVGRLEGGAFQWTRSAAGETLVGLSVPALVASDGDRVVMISWDRGTEAIRVSTTSDGEHWSAMQPPAAGFGGIPHLAAGDSAGILVMGSRIEQEQTMPVLWFLDGNTWHSTPVPEFARQPAGPTACPPPPADALDFLQLDPSTGLRCFGDRPLTFPGWVSPCQGCSGDPMPGYDPDWLADPNSDRFLFSPIAAEGWAWTNGAVLDPSLSHDPGWDSNWEMITGHFDDPAAPTCTYRPQNSAEIWYPGRAEVIQNCRRTFVVTKVTPTEAPT